MNVFKTLLATAAVAALASGSPARAADGKTFLLTVGVGRSPKMPSFRPLPNADKAAIRLYYALREMMPEARRDTVHLGDSMGGSQAPTVANVRAVLARFAAAATKDDRVIVAFVGHGFHTVGDAKKGEPEHDAVVLGDSDLNDPKSFLTVGEIFGRVTAMKCRDGAVFIDACRDFRDDLKVAVDPAYRPTGRTFADDLDRRERGPADRDRRVCLVQACEAGTYAYEEDEGRGGLMTESLTLALSKTRPEKEGTADIDGDGVVTIHEAVGYARTRVQIHARNRHRTVQKLTDEPAAEAFALANVDKSTGGKPTDVAAGPKPAADKVADAPTGLQAPKLEYAGMTATLQGGPPLTPASRGVVGNSNAAPAGWNGGFAYGQGLPGVMVGGGINPSSPGGQVLNVLHGAGVPNLPPTGTPLLNWGLNQIPGFRR